MKKAFITGINGFLGINLTNELLKRNWEVKGLYLPGTDIKYLPRNIEIIPANIINYNQLLEIIPQNVDVIFHMAANTSTWAKNNEKQYIDNVVGTKNMVKIAIQKNADKFIYTSSISSYGYQSGKIINENTKSNALSCNMNYNKTKFLAEKIIKENISNKFKPVILNPCNILGPYDINNWTKRFIEPIYNGKLKIIPPGESMWCHVEDIVEAHINAYYYGKIGENYLLGGTKAKFLDVINEVKSVMGKTQSKKSNGKLTMMFLLNLSLLKSKLDKKEPELTFEKYNRAIGNIQCDFSKAKKDLNFKVSTLNKMIHDTFIWLESKNLLTKYVDLKKEPLHKEKFIDENVRIYNATIKPGEKTLYHRHTENTIYYVVKGGKTKNQMLYKNDKYKVVFPKKFHFIKKINLAKGKLFKGYVNLPDNLIFCMLNKKSNCIHRAISYKNNMIPIEIMGIEILKPSIKNIPNLKHLIIYDNKNFRVYLVKLKKNKSININSLKDGFLILCTKGNIKIESNSDSTNLKRTEYKSINTSQKNIIYNNYNSISEFLLI